MTRITHKGVYYFDSHNYAETWARTGGFPTNRIIEYKRGYAIQLHVSGPYAGPDLHDQTDIARHHCDYCKAA